MSETATDAAYMLRVAVDGDELTLPFKAYAGTDYGIGDPLDKIAKDFAFRIHSRSFPNAGCVKVMIYECQPDDCTGDDDPVELASGEAYGD
jgi:hypothetical protein